MQRKKYGKIVLGAVCFALLLAGCAKQKAGMEAGERQERTGRFGFYGAEICR